VKAGKIRRSIDRFSDFSNDLLSSDMNTFEDRISMLISYAKSDEFFKDLHQQLTTNKSVNFDEWLSSLKETIGGMVGSGNLSFPTDLEQRLSLMYQLLCKIESGDLDLLSFTSDFFAIGSSRIDEHIYSFNNAISEPLFRELGYRLQDIEDELPENNKIEVESPLFQIIHHAENVIQQNAIGSNNQQTASIQQESSELGDLFTRLENELASLKNSHENVAEHLEIVSTCKELALQETPKVSAIKKLLSTLPALGNIASISSAIISAIAL
jgi:hypothetical protein